MSKPKKTLLAKYRRAKCALRSSERSCEALYEDRNRYAEALLSVAGRDAGVAARALDEAEVRLKANAAADVITRTMESAVMAIDLHRAYEARLPMADYFVLDTEDAKPLDPATYVRV